MIILTYVSFRTVISWWDYFIYGQEPIEQQVDLESRGNDGSPSVQIRTIEVKSTIFIKQLSDILFTKMKKKDIKRAHRERETNSVGLYF